MTPNLILLLLPLCYGAPEDFTSLVQTKVGSNARLSDPFPGKRDINNLYKVNEAISQLKQFKKDLIVALDTDSPFVNTNIKQADLDKCNSYLSMLGIQAREIKMKNQRVHRPLLFSWTPPPDVQGVSQFFAQMEKNLYPEIDDAIHFVSSEGSICMEGEAGYVRKVLHRLHTSPMMYGFQSPHTQLKRGSCTKSGFSLRTEEYEPKMCYPGLNVFVSQSPLKENSYTEFKEQMLEKWMKAQGKGEKYTEAAMRNVCVLS